MRELSTGMRPGSPQGAIKVALLHAGGRGGGTYHWNWDLNIFGIFHIDGYFGSEVSRPGLVGGGSDDVVLFV